MNARIRQASTVEHHPNACVRSMGSIFNRQVFWLPVTLTAFPFSQWQIGERLYLVTAAAPRRIYTVFPILPLNQTD